MWRRSIAAAHAVRNGPSGPCWQVASDGLLASGLMDTTRVEIILSIGIGNE